MAEQVTTTRRPGKPARRQFVERVAAGVVARASWDGFRALLAELFGS